MALDFNNNFKTSLLSNYHSFIPKIILSDRARVKNIISPTITDLSITPTIVERNEIQQQIPLLFSSVKIGEINYIFITPKSGENDTYVSGLEFNKIYVITKEGNNISTPTALNLTFNVDFINCFEFYYNSNTGQFGVVYGGYSDIYHKTYLKRLILDNGVIKEIDETKFPTSRGDFFTASSLDNGKLVVMTIYLHGAIKKYCFEVDLTKEVLSNENGNFADNVLTETSDIFTGGQVVNFKSCAVGDNFYYIETIYNKGIYQTNLYDTNIFGYTPYVSSQIFNSIYNTGTGLVFTSSTEDGKYKIYNSDYQMRIRDIVNINGESDLVDTFNFCNYLYFGDFVLYENEKNLYLQGTKYTITYTESNTEIELPTERVISIDFESVSDNLKTRVIKICLNNDNGFFTNYGTKGEYSYKNFFYSKTPSRKKIIFLIGDNETKDDKGVIYETIYTGFLDTTTKTMDGKINITCFDALEIMKETECQPKTYSYINGDDYIVDLCKQAGFNDIIFETNTDYTIEKYKIDRRQNVLDAIKKILDICNLKMYVDRYGKIVITQRLLYKENIININNRHVVGIDSQELSTIKNTRNIVRIITDNENDVYVEARDDKAIANMGYESVMELDYSGLFGKISSSKNVEYKTPTDEMILDALSQLAPTMYAKEKAKIFATLSCGKFPYHSRYLYLLTFWYKDDSTKIEQCLVGCEVPLSFKLQNNSVYAITSSASSVGINCYGPYIGESGYCNMMTTYTPVLSNPGYGANIQIGVESFKEVKIYPNKDYIKGKEYEEIPPINKFLDFKKDLIDKIKNDYKIPISEEEENKIKEFLNIYGNSDYELFMYSSRHDETVVGATPNLSPMDSNGTNIFAIKKDLTYLNEEPETYTIVKKNNCGRYNYLTPIDGMPKEYIDYNNWKAGRTEMKTMVGLNVDFGFGSSNYACIDFFWNRTTDVVKNKISALDLANRILKQVCRNVQIDNIKTTPLLFLTPEDIVYLDCLDTKGYRTVKSIKHSFKFYRGSIAYECSINLQEATENIDFFLIKEE